MLSMHKKWGIIISILLIPVLLFSQDGKILAKILQRGELRVGTSGVQPPFSMISKDGQLMGYEIELAEILAEAIYLKVRFIQKPFQEFAPALEKGEIDAIMSGMTITPERNLKFTFVGPYILSG